LRADAEWFLPYRYAMKKYLLPCLAIAAALGAAQPTAAQTGRIAYFSHGGSAATLAAAEAADNFGLPGNRSEHITDSLVYLNDSLALSYGRFRVARWQEGEEALKKAKWQPNNGQIQYYSQAYHPQRWEEAVQDLRRQNPQAKLIGFDKQLKKPVRKKPTSQLSFPKRPFQYSFWRAVTGVAGLGAVGWLLGRKRAA
jgi:hypothetical protein